MQKETLKVYGMKCVACDEIIQDSLTAIEGVASVKADYKTGSVELAFDPEKTNLQVLEAIIEKDEFSMTEIKSEQEKVEELSLWQVILQFIKSLKG